MGEGRLAVERWLRQVKVMPSPDPKPPKSPASDGAGKPATQRPRSPAAERALAEAAARRAANDRPAPDRPKELRGRDGPEPTRYGDWEIKGLTSDF